MTTQQATLEVNRALAALMHAAQSTGDRRLVEAANAAAAAYDTIALDRLGLQQELAEMTMTAEREVHKSATVARIAEMMNSSLEIDIVLRRVLDAAVDVLGAQRGFVMIADDATGGLQLAALHGIDRASLESDEMRPSQTTVFEVFASGETVVSTDAQNDPRFNADASVRILNLRSIICVPLVSKSRRLGVVYLDSRVTPGLFTPQDPSLLIAFADQAALAIENARLFNEQRAQLREIMWLENLQAKVLSSITSGVITIDAGGTIATFNGAAASTFGVPAESMTGKPVGLLDELVPGLVKLLDDPQQRGRPIELTAIHPARGALTLQVRLAPLDLADSEHTTKPTVAIAITDLTEQRALEAMHRTEVEERHAIGDAFSRYLAPHVVDLLMTAPSAVELGGERKTATILFADIRDFTKMAARLQAERVVEILNAYFEAAVQVIFENDGLLDKFYGDGLMAVFGPPRVHADDAARALRSAARLHEVVRELEPIIGEPLRISVGLATGDVVAGHIGSTRRLDYTVIGDAVNLASRLQSAAPPAATYCDETTYVRSALNLPGERLQAKIKGREDLVTVYRLT